MASWTATHRITYAGISVDVMVVEAVGTAWTLAEWTSKTAEPRWTISFGEWLLDERFPNGEVLVEPIGGA